MSKQNLYLIINTLILLVLGLVFILLYSTVIPTEPKDKLFSQVITLDEEVVLNSLPVTGHYENLHSVQNAFNTRGDKIGVVYHVFARNGFIDNPTDEYGYIELLVGIDLEDNVYVQIVVLQQKSVYNAAIQDYINKYYQGFSVNDFLSIPVINVEELEAGATASTSTGSVKSLIGMAIDNYLSQTLSLSEVTKG